MKVHKWASNNSIVLQSIPSAERSPCKIEKKQASSDGCLKHKLSDTNRTTTEDDSVTFSQESTSIMTNDTKALGIMWSPSKDEFNYSCYNKLKDGIVYSKRGISSIIPKI